MKTECDIYEAEQQVLKINDENQPIPVSITEEEWIDLLAIALS